MEPTTQNLECPDCGRTGSVVIGNGPTGQKTASSVPEGFVSVQRAGSPTHFECAQCRTPAKISGEPENAGPRVLVIEDDEVARYATARELTAAGFKVVTAAGYYRALAIIAEPRSIDLLIADIELGDGLDGLTIARMAKRQHPMLKVLFITAYDVPEGAPVLGAVLKKPITNDALVTWVRHTFIDKAAS